ncbi:MAG: sigma-E processing peptidase SpoIIGA, partial [Bacillota bacterium]
MTLAKQIFLDDLILYNLLMNGLLLAITAYLLRETIKWWRLLLGAGFGSLYLIAFFIPGLRAFTSMLVRLVCPIPMVWLAFPRRRPIELVRLCGTFYLVAMAAGGVSLGGYFLARTSIWWQRGTLALQGLPSWLPLAGTMVLFSLMRWFVTITRPIWRRVGREYLVRFTLGGQAITVRALLDTGNELKDPITGRPVMIVEHHALPMVPLPQGYSGHDDEVCQLAEQLAQTSLVDRIHLLP